MPPTETETEAAPAASSAPPHEYPPHHRLKDLAYFKNHLTLMPAHYTSVDISRMTFAFFALSALDLMSEIGNLDGGVKQGWVEWIYAQQICDDGGGTLARCGFRGSPIAGASFGTNSSIHAHGAAHITMTYTALACLLILGDDLGRVDVNGIVGALALLQVDSGSFKPTHDSDPIESDMRFLFCACVISFLLNDWRGVDKEKAISYILASQGHDGAFGQGPGLEAHGGSTYCALASLSLLSSLDRLPNRVALTHWLVLRQQEEGGFNGRPGKDADTCYAFWVGGSLEILGAYDLIDTEALHTFLDSTRSKYGGFGKAVESYPDLMHANMGIAGLSIMRVPGLQRIHVPTAMTARTVGRLEGCVPWRKGKTVRDGETS
ncbi:terpenoid cyclases/protein prenyltransferase alpha-alpha toroid [Fimicolochytrium jonesii]|uniref:terpenoid cyclases/protein prenyltransferase alpha-alpha toroid n=1 Tax=Fimicolochytrium jonesii TaxID=1396493 RepID=UPI0022FE22D3|nr:terpenoid cyclases/protein prenyltransferase alpha-alpha toroid [Fimicolochytrium jonesii]KAI8818036.1 terpenoid cyclases/protein prenyltransferase alpha-alpha toroid [Fimicolochytrium jonesii]